MPRPKSRKPTYRLDKSSGRAFVEIDRRRFYLGKYDTPESRDRYDQLVGEWIARGRQLPATAADAGDVTVSTVIAAFWQHATRYYVEPDGRPSGEQTNFRETLRPLRRLYGPTAAKDFGPLSLQALMAEMVRLGWCRSHVNRQASRVRHVFKWAAAQELVPASIHHALQTVQGLRRGRSEARESEPVKPVPEAHVEATLPHVSPQVKAMIELQLLTGMRPGEVVIIRGRDVDTAGKLWIYKPASHKNAHRGHERAVPLGPKAQAVLAPFLKPDVSAYLFSPRDAEAARYAARPHHRRAPALAPETGRKLRDRYDVCSYRKAIHYGCDKAFPPPPPLAPLKGESVVARWMRLTPAERRALAQWQDEHRWSPNQLRHAAATRVRRQYGLDAAQVMLGHRHADVTQIYAEKDSKLAERIAGEIG